MLRVYRASGDLLAEFTQEDLQKLANADKCPGHVLKKHLQTLCGQLRFKQRLLKEGSTVHNDDAFLEPPLDLTLVLVPFVTASTAQIDELIKAARRGDVSVVEDCLNRPQEPDPPGQKASALHHAVQNGHVDVARLLLEAGASKDRTTKENNTPLCLAAELEHAGQVQCIQLLLESRADVEIANSEGRSPLLQALSSTTSGAWAEVAQCTKVADLLLKARANVEKTDNLGKPALVYACEKGCTDMVKMILEAGAEVNQPCTRELGDTSRGSSALHRAAARGRLDVARMLLSARAEVEKVDANGWTPLFKAVRHAHSEMVQLLLDAGADWLKKDSSGESPASIAKVFGDEDILHLLKKKKEPTQPFKRPRLART
ncbi:kidins220b [Symbiodinium microadriaticum]|nr:kidins220b [Symbiodinium microadriaticum]CAE7927712.1 kidins220b [Symbiodinium sp. KB8]